MKLSIMRAALPPPLKILPVFVAAGRAAAAAARCKKSSCRSIWRYMVEPMCREKPWKVAEIILSVEAPGDHSYKCPQALTRSNEVMIACTILTLPLIIFLEASSWTLDTVSTKLV